MPKGVYVRAPKSQPAESAKPVETPVESKGSYREGGAQIRIPESNSSEALFGPSEVVEEAQPEPVQEAPKVEEPKVEEPVATPEPKPESTAPETVEEVDFDDLLKKMNLDPTKVKVKTKVDGVESVVPYAELKKSYQLEQHLTKRGQKIGEERRQLEALRDSLARTPNPQPSVAESSDPTVRALQERLARFEAYIPALEPVVYQNARQQLANELKAQGFPDFMDYVDKIDARVAAEADDNKWRYYNTPEGAKALFFQLKLEDQAKNVNVPAAKPIVTPVPQPTKPPIVRIDGGGQATSSVNDDTNAKIDEAMAKWRANPRDKVALQRLLQLKGALSLK